MTSFPTSSNGATGPVGGRRKRVLLISYIFPPTGGSGVQRVTKFVKYLPRHGWDVSVLTVANPSVPLFDPTLVNDIPADTVIRRTHSWEPGYSLKASVGVEGANQKQQRRGLAVRLLAGSARQVAKFTLQPDPQILWLPGAISGGKQLLRRIPHDAVLASAPPFTNFLVGRAVSRSAGVPLVLDYRDEWTISNTYLEHKQVDPLSRVIQGQMQRQVLRTAHGVIATTRSSAESLAALSRRSGGHAAVTWIYNGFDPDDFRSPPQPGTPSHLRLAYVGTLWTLTSVAPLVEAVTRLAKESPDLASGLELAFAGRRLGVQAEHVARLRGLPCRVVEYPYLDHAAAVGLMRGCDAQCLLLSDLPGVGRVVPAKVFEYMAAARPMLTIAPRGELWDLLDGYPGGRFVPGDVEGITRWLAAAVRDHRSGQFARQAARWDASAYTRDNEAGQLARLMDSILAEKAERDRPPQRFALH
jgi:glycosyltransferase involved in cell wall biosynthesis